MDVNLNSADGGLATGENDAAVVNPGVTIANASAEDGQVPAEVVPSLINPDQPGQGVNLLTDGLLLGVAVRGNVLDQAIEGLVETMVTQIVDQLPLVGDDLNEIESVDSITERIFSSPRFIQIRDSLVRGNANLVNGVAEIAETFGLTGSDGSVPGVAPPSEQFNLLNLFGAEVTFAPLNQEVLNNIGDGEGTIGSDIVDTFLDFLGTGTVSVKIYTSELGNLPGFNGDVVNLTTRAAVSSITAFGGAEVGADTETIVNEFLLASGSGLIPSLGLSDNPNINNIQIGFGLNQISLNENDLPQVDRINLSILDGNVIGAIGPAYWADADLRRITISRNADDTWSPSGFFSATSLNEFGYNILAGNENRQGEINIITDVIGRFAFYLDKDDLVQDSIFVDAQGTLGQLLEYEGTTYFRPFNEQENTLFTNVFLNGADAVLLEDIPTIPAGTEYEILTPELIAEASAPSPVTQWLLDNAGEPWVQNLFTAGVAVGPSLFTGNPLLIAEGIYGAGTQISETTFNRFYDAAVESYTASEGETAGEFSADGFLVGEFSTITSQLERAEELFQEYKQTDFYDGETFEEFLTQDYRPDISLVADDDFEGLEAAADIRLEAQLIVDGVEGHVKLLEASFVRLITNGEATVEELYTALSRYAEPDSAGSLGNAAPVLSTIAARLFGEGGDIILYADINGDAENPTNFTTSDVSGLAANALGLFLDDGTPAELRILFETEGLTNLEDFDLNDLNDIENLTSSRSLITSLLEGNDDVAGVDPFQIYEALEFTTTDEEIDLIIEEVPALAIPREVANAFEDTLLGSRDALFDEVDGGFFQEGNSLSFHLDRFRSFSAQQVDFTTEGLSQFFADFEAYLTGDPGLEGARQTGVGLGVVAGQSVFDTFVQNVAGGLLASGAGDFPEGTGVSALDQELARLIEIRDSDVPDGELLAAYPITEELQEDIVAARAAKADGLPNVQQYFSRDNLVLSLEPGADRAVVGLRPNAPNLGLDGDGPVQVAAGLYLPGDVITDHDGSLLFIVPTDATIPVDQALPEAESILTPEQIAFQTRFEELQTEEGGGYTEEQASGIAYSEYQVALLDENPDDGVFTNPVARDARYEAATLNTVVEDEDGQVIEGGQPPLDQGAFNVIFDFENNRFLTAVETAREETDTAAGQEAIAFLQSAGAEVDEDGVLVTAGVGGATLQAAKYAGDRGADAELNAAVTAQIAEGLDPASIEAGLAGDAVEGAGPPDLTGLSNDAAQRAAVEFFAQESDAAFAEGRNFEGFALGSLGTVVSLADVDTLDAGALSNLFTAAAPILDQVVSESAQSTFTNVAADFHAILDANGALPSNSTVLAVSGGAFLGSIIKEIGVAEGSDLARFSGIGVEATLSFTNAFLQQGEAGFDFAQSIEDISFSTLTELSAGVPVFEEAVQAYVFGDSAIDVLNGNVGVSESGLINAGGQVLGSFFDDATSAQIVQGFGLGSRAYDLFSGNLDLFTEGQQQALSRIGLGGLSDRLANSSFYSTGGTVAGAVALFVEVLDYVGVDVPNELAYAAQTAALAFSGPVGWVGFFVDLGLRLFGGASGTTITTYQAGIDSDADGLQDDDALLSTDWHTNFWRERSVDDGRLLYETNGVNPEFLEYATFDLIPPSERNASFSPYESGDEDDSGHPDRVIVDGVIINGDLGSVAGLSDVGDSRVVNFEPDENSSGIEALIEAGILNEAPATIPIVLTRVEESRNSISRYNVSDDDGSPFEYSVDPNWLATLNPSIQITGEYAGINPVTGGESFDETIVLTPEQYDAALAELGGAEAVTLNGADARLRAEDGSPAATTLANLMDGLTITFDSNDRDPNFYQYLDMNGDGNLDLVRYGIRADGDGLHSGDERYEIILLDENRNRLGVRDPETGAVLRDENGHAVAEIPTITVADLNHGGQIATLSPYLYMWAASRPEQGAVGYDPVSIYNAAAEAGHLDDLIELRSLDARVSAGVELADNLQAAGEDYQPTDAETAAGVAVFDSAASAAPLANALRQELGILDVEAYAAANPEVGALYANSPDRITELAYHYIRIGGNEGHAIDAEGTVLAPRVPPVWHGITYIGSRLEPGERMQKNEMLLSENGQFATVFNQEGELITYDLSSGSPQAVWEADRAGNTDDGWVEMQADGNLVIYDDDADAEWSSSTDSQTGPAHGNFAAVLGDDGVLSVHDEDTGAILWSGGPGETANDGEGVTFARAAPGLVDPTADRSAGSDLEIVAITQIEGTTLETGQAILSGNGRFALELTEDGTLRVVDNSTGVYTLIDNDASGLGPNASLEVGREGELTLRADDGPLEVFSTGTGAPSVDRPVFLRIHDDGGVALVDSQFNTPLWIAGVGTVAQAQPDIEVVGSSISSGEGDPNVLLQGQALVSENGQTLLQLGHDGVLLARDMVTQEQTVVAGGGAALYAEENGNVTLTDAAGAVVWTTGTRLAEGVDGAGSHFMLRANDDGSVVLTDEQFGTPLWSARAGLIETADAPNVVVGDSQVGGLIVPGDALQSQNGQFVMELDHEGRLVIRNLVNDAVDVIEDGGPGSVLDLQDDGNLVLYTADRDDVVWSTDTYFEDGELRPFTLALGDDGNLVWRDDASGEALWSRHTGYLRDAPSHPA